MKIKNLFALLIGALIVTSCGEDGAGEDPKLTLEAALSAGAVSVYEDAGDQSFTIDFGVELDRFVEVQINFGGTAVYGEDYTTNLGAADSYTLNFQPETESGTFTLSPIDNTDEDGERTIEISVVIDDNRVDVTTGTVTITLRDDESIAKNFLLNSPKTTLANLSLSCSADIPVIEYTDGMASLLTFEDYFGDPTGPDLLVSYSRDTVLFSVDPSSFRTAEEPEEYVVMKAVVDEEKVQEVIFNLGGPGRIDAPMGLNGKVEEPSSYYYSVDLSYNDDGFVESYVFGVKNGDTDELLDEFYSMIFDYTSSTAVDVTFDFSGYRLDGEVPETTSLTLDGMKNPISGFTGLSYFVLHGPEGGIRDYLHAILPSNLVSGWESNQGPVEYDYSYNAEGYPTSSTTTKGTEVVERLDGPGQTVWINTFQYLDMDGGDDVVLPLQCD